MGVEHDQLQHIKNIRFHISEWFKENRYIDPGTLTVISPYNIQIIQEKSSERNT